MDDSNATRPMVDDQPLTTGETQPSSTPNPSAEPTSHEQPAEEAQAARERRGEPDDSLRQAQSIFHRPAVGAGIAGVTVLAAGAFCGATEAAVAAVAAYGAYRILRRKKSR